MFEEEVSPQTITKYISCMQNLSICTGKLDMIIAYCEQHYSKDAFLLASLVSLFRDITNANGDKFYKRTTVDNGINIRQCEIKTIRDDINAQEGGLNYKKVQTPHVDNKVSLQPIIASSKLINDSDINRINIIEHDFKNSTNLKSLKYNSGSKKLSVLFKNNNREYDYISVVASKVDMLIKLDEANQSPGKYFNSEIASIYDYREITHDKEIVG